MYGPVITCKISPVFPILTKSGQLLRAVHVRPHSYDKLWITSHGLHFALLQIRQIVSVNVFRCFSSAQIPLIFPRSSFPSGNGYYVSHSINANVNIYVLCTIMLLHTNTTWLSNVQFLAQKSSCLFQVIQLFALYSDMNLTVTLDEGRKSAAGSGSSKRAKWHLGIRSQSKPHDIMHEVFRAMTTLSFEWKIINPFHVRVRRKNPVSGNYVSSYVDSLASFGRYFPLHHVQQCILYDAWASGVGY